MIIYGGCNRLAAAFARFLGAQWPSARDVTLVVADDDFEAVEADGQRGFGAYLREGDDASIAVISPAAWAEVLRENGEAPEDAEREFLLTIAHEYAHHLQAERAGLLSQEDADQFAEQAVEAFHGAERRCENAEVSQEASGY